MTQEKQCKILSRQIDDVARATPDVVLLQLLDPPHCDDPVLPLTYGAFKNSMDRLAWWLREQAAEHEIAKFDTVLYIGQPDIRYFLVLLAAMKNQITVLFSAPLNDTAAHLSLMQATGCRLLFHSAEDSPLALIGQCDVPSVEIPSATALLGAAAVPDFIYDKSFTEAANDPVAYFHTSGTTGKPKPILWAQTNLAFLPLSQKHMRRHGKDAWLDPDHPTTRNTPRRRTLMSFSAYHVSMALSLTKAVYEHRLVTLTPLHLPIASYTPTLMTDFLCRAQCEELMTFPARLEGAVKDASYANQLRGLVAITYGGAPLSPHFVELFEAAPTRLNVLWGATEVLVNLPPMEDKRDWEYVDVCTAETGIHARHFHDDLYEMVVVRDDTLSMPQPTFQSFPDRQEYRVGDLFTRHPSKENLWKFAGRVDDNIVLTVGQNINPKEFEQEMAKHQLVKSITMLGTGRPSPCLIIELHDYEDAEAQIDELWPVMQQAFAGRAGYDHVARSRIIVANPSKPLPVSPKGNVKRNALYTLYRDEIDQCY